MKWRSKDGLKDAVAMLVTSFRYRSKRHSLLWYIMIKDTVHIAFQLYYLCSNVTQTPSFSDRQLHVKASYLSLLNLATIEAII